MVLLFLLMLLFVCLLLCLNLFERCVCVSDELMLLEDRLSQKLQFGLDEASSSILTEHEPVISSLGPFGFKLSVRTAD